MTTLNELLTRVRTALQDATGTRFSSGLLEEAVHLALDEISQSCPLMVDTPLTIATAGRDQLITGVVDPLFLVKLVCADGQQLEPEVQFSYTLQAGQPVVHFLGSRIPQAGDVFTVTSALRHTLSGLEGSPSTTLPDGFISALVIGAAGQACLLRVGALAESYGGRSQETARLIDLSRLLLDQFQKQVEGMKILQEFGFPPGFALDHWDSKNRKVF